MAGSENFQVFRACFENNLYNFIKNKYSENIKNQFSD